MPDFLYKLNVFSGGHPKKLLNLGDWTNKYKSVLNYKIPALFCVSPSNELPVP